MYRPFSPRPYARVRDQSMFCKETRIDHCCRVAHGQIAMVAKPAIQVERSPPGRKSVVGHRNQRGRPGRPDECFTDDPIERDI